jgi:hypothetical protein
MLVLLAYIDFFLNIITVKILSNAKFQLRKFF